MTPTPASPLHAHRRNRPAFTLVEILTATAIMIIIILVMLVISTETITAYDGAIANIETTSQARRVQEALQKDLESAILRDDGNTWIQVEHPAEVGNLTRGSTPHLMLFSPAADRTKREGTRTGRIPGATCAINYQIAQRSPFHNPGEHIQQIYGLYRAIADARATFTTALPIIIGDTKTGAQGQPPLAFWQGTAEVMDINGNRASQNLMEWAASAQNFQTTNVVGLTLVFWYFDTETRQMNAITHEENANSVREACAKAGLSPRVIPYLGDLKINATQFIVDNNSGAPIKGHLKHIDYATTILSPDGAKQLRGLQHTAKSPRIPAEKFKEILTAHGFIFTGTANIAGQ
ncbi:MAG: hypothetical protein LBD14_00105 [Puniceicoccales bacterium]|jgi:type II secretory pathway pseudopilin PulG|nr:hypothetical protein [Puniceicoccales bacterium]